MTETQTMNEENTVEKSANQELLGNLLAGLLALQGLSSSRMDETLARQAVKDNQRESHLNTMSAIQSAYEVTMPEAFAVAKLAQSYQSGDSSAQNLSAITPHVQFKVVPA